MSLEVDGAAILKALAKTPRAFAMSKAEVDRIATAAVAMKLKEKGLPLTAVRTIAKVLGARDFSTIVGDLPAKDAKALARLDIGHPDYATADEHWCRAHIIRLASGEAQPVTAGAEASRPTHPAPPKQAASKEAAAKQTPQKLPKIGRIMASAAQATATRVRHPRGRAAAKGRA